MDEFDFDETDMSSSIKDLKKKNQYIKTLEYKNIQQDLYNDINLEKSINNIKYMNTKKPHPVKNQTIKKKKNLYVNLLIFSLIFFLVNNFYFNEYLINKKFSYYIIVFFKLVLFLFLFYLYKFFVY